MQWISIKDKQKHFLLKAERASLKTHMYVGSTFIFSDRCGYVSFIAINPTKHLGSDFKQ